MEKYTFSNLLEMKKNKTGVSVLRKWLFSGLVIDEVELAKILSSTMTHALIEVEGEPDPELKVTKALGYKIDLLATFVRNLILGETSLPVIKRKLESIISEEEDL